MELTLAILSIFLWEVLDNLFYEGVFVFDLILLFVYILRRKKVVIPKESFFIMALLLHFIICMFQGTADTFSFMKQFFGILLTMIYYYNIIYYYGLNCVMHKYCDVAMVFAYYGILQEVLGLLNVDILVTLRWLVAGMKNEKVLGIFQRCVGLCMEPFNFAMLLLPALYISIATIYKKTDISYYNKIQSIIIIFAYIFTFSSAGYIGAFIAIWLVVTKNLQRFQFKAFIKKFSGVIVIIAIFLVGYFLVPEFKVRIDDTLRALMDINDLTYVNLSSYALISSFHIALNMFRMTSGIGVGLGSYGVNYENYSSMLNSSLWMYGINREDASSMMLRLIAEIGIFTVIIIVYLVKCRKKHPVQNIDISNAMLSYIVLRLLRSGNYIFGGAMFFFCMYFLCVRKDRISESLNNNYNL